jgi:crotonobetainyl-CoA:carnitine CoA-transferase CaiB-like acyl-CoA transferase
VQNRESLNAALNRVFAAQPAHHWIDLLNRSGVPAGPVYSVPQMLEDPQVKFSTMTKEIVSDGHRFGFVTQPVILGRTPADIVREAPAWGADTDDIMQELGYEASEIQSLRECGAI